MTSGLTAMFWPFSIFVIMIMVIGFYCVLVSFNLIRALIGVELLIKAVTLLLILVGYITGQTALAQSLVITLIVIEVVVMVVAAGIILRIYGHNDSVDVRDLLKFKEKDNKNA
jgi:multisubunit Na+/H+ antiporter MnhC subunit